MTTDEAGELFGYGSWAMARMSLEFQHIDFRAPFGGRHGIA
jgi:hypothetical protein